MASYNRVILVGNLTRDPEVRYLPSGTAVSNVGIAVSRTWVDKQTNERREETTFVDVTLWGRQAEVAGEDLTKGRPVLIEGRLHLDQWEDRQTGQKQSRLKVVGEYMQMLGSRPDSARAAHPQAEAQYTPPAYEESGPPTANYTEMEDNSSPPAPPGNHVPF